MRAEGRTARAGEPLAPTHPDQPGRGVINKARSLRGEWSEWDFELATSRFMSLACYRAAPHPAMLWG